MVQPAGRAQVHIGQTSVTYLPDGHAWLDPAVVFPASAPDGWATHAEYLDPDGRFPVSIGSFLVRAADRVILVDLGLGAAEWGNADLRADFRGGDLISSLAAEGLTPSDVDTVFFTHLHHDHVGWATDVAPVPGAAPVDPAGLTFGEARHLVGLAPAGVFISDHQCSSWRSSSWLSGWARGWGLVRPWVGRVGVLSVGGRSVGVVASGRGSIAVRCWG